MADPVYLILVVLHVAVAATAFAITLPIASAIRRATGQGRDVKSAIATMAARAGATAGLFGLLTFATGLALIFYRGGFKVVPPTIHASLGLILVMIAIGTFFQRPTTVRLTAAVDQGDDAWRAARKRWVMGDGIMSLLWVVILALMFIKPA